MEGIDRARICRDGAVGTGTMACIVSKEAHSSDVQAADGRAFYVRVAIGNHRQLARIGGAEMVSHLLERLYRHAVALVGHRDGIVLREDGLTMIVEGDAVSNAAAFAPAKWAGIAVEHMVLQRLIDPVERDAAPHSPAWRVTAHAIPPELLESVGDEPVGAARSLLEAKLAARYPALPIATPFEHNESDFRRDMAVVERVQSAMDDGRVVLRWQPIAAADAPGCMLYCEGQAMIADPKQRFSDSNRADMVATAELMPALRRLGLARAFDAHVMGLTVEHLLRVKTARLGCSIASQSATVDGWWLPVLRVLKAMPSVAQRLTIEIDGSEAMAALGTAATFVTEFRALGCRIAVGSFGNGLMGVRDIAALAPDVVKIDRSFLQMGDDPMGLTVSRRMIALAEAIGHDVVLEGVDSAEAEAVALRLGGRWLQGSFIASAAMTLRSSHDPARPSPDPGGRATATAAHPAASFAETVPNVWRSLVGSLGFSKLWSAESQ